MRKYDPATDFARIRDFLQRSESSDQPSSNWKVNRWNYARYFIAPMLGAYGQDDAIGLEGSLQSIRFWEDVIRIWETGTGEIAGVVNIEHPSLDHRGFGEICLQRGPDQGALLDELLEYGERALVNPKTNAVHIWVREEDRELQEAVARRGYIKRADDCDYDSEYPIADPSAIPAPSIPEGYTLRSMADPGGDIHRRRELFGRSFNHPEPSEWPSAFTYRELQRAPDYRKDLDLFIVAPDGRYVSGCIVWVDAVNRHGVLEPVGTHPDFRKLGLGREVVLEAIRRAAALGAKKVYGFTGGFYGAIGFEMKNANYRWDKQL